MTVLEGELSKVPSNRHWDAILDIHAKPWPQRWRWGFGPNQPIFGWRPPLLLHFVDL